MRVILVFVLRESMHFREDMCQNDFHFRFPVTLTYDLVTYKLLCQLLLT